MKTMKNLGISVALALCLSVVTTSMVQIGSTLLGSESLTPQDGGKLALALWAMFTAIIACYDLTERDQSIEVLEADRIASSAKIKALDKEVENLTQKLRTATRWSDFARKERETTQERHEAELAEARYRGFDNGDCMLWAKVRPAGTDEKPRAQMRKVGEKPAFYLVIRDGQARPYIALLNQPVLGKGPYNFIINGNIELSIRRMQLPGLEEETTFLVRYLDGHASTLARNVKDGDILKFGACVMTVSDTLLDATTDFVMMGRGEGWLNAREQLSRIRQSEPSVDESSSSLTQA